MSRQKNTDPLHLDSGEDLPEEAHSSEQAPSDPVAEKPGESASPEAEPAAEKPAPAPAAKPKRPKRKKVTEIGKKEPVTYIGPTLPGGKLSQYSTFRNGLPANVRKLVEECKALERLFVPVSSLAASKQKLRDRSSLHHAHSEQVRKHFNKGAK